jgi:uncharacterized protein YceK
LSWFVDAALTLVMDQRSGIDSIGRLAILPPVRQGEWRMTKPSGLALWAICAVCAVPGCGTVQNLRDSAADPPAARVYGGVRYDIEGSTNDLTDMDGGHGGLPGLLVERVLGTYLLLVDLPLSAVGDTLTLPITWAASKEQHEAKPPPTASSSSNVR